MKISEIIVESIDVDRVHSVSLYKNKRSPLRGEVIGYGVQAKVHKGSQGVVNKEIKILASVGLDDTSVKFVKLVSEHQDNPFFPKIYHAKVYRDKNPEYKKYHWLLFVQMEKLIPLDNSMIDDVSADVFSNAGIEVADELRAVRNQRTRTSFLAKDTSDLVYKYLHGVSDEPGTYQSKEEIKNPKYNEAVRLMAPLMRQHGLDLHSGNFMVRLTSSGPQLVFVDPLYPDTFMRNAKYASTRIY